MAWWPDRIPPSPEQPQGQLPPTPKFEIPPPAPPYTHAEEMNKPTKMAASDTTPPIPEIPIQALRSDIGK